MKSLNSVLIVFVFSLTVFGGGISVFADETASSIMCDNGTVEIGDMKTDVQNACGEPDSQGTKEWVYNFGPSQPVYTLIFEEDKLVKILENEWGN